MINLEPVKLGGADYRAIARTFGHVRQYGTVVALRPDRPEHMDLGPRSDGNNRFAIGGTSATCDVETGVFGGCDEAPVLVCLAPASGGRCLAPF